MLLPIHVLLLTSIRLSLADSETRQLCQVPLFKQLLFRASQNWHLDSRFAIIGVMTQSGYTVTVSALQERLVQINDAAANLNQSLLDNEQSVSIQKQENQSSRLSLIDACHELLEYLHGPEDFLKLSIPIVSDGANWPLS